MRSIGSDYEYNKYMELSTRIKRDKEHERDRYRSRDHERSRSRERYRIGFLLFYKNLMISQLLEGVLMEHVE